MADLQETPTNQTDVPTEEEKVVEITTPIMVDLGKQQAKRLKALKRGKGKLMNEVAEILEEVALNLADEVDGKTLVPVILMYEKKKKRKKKFRMFNF